MNKIQAFEMWCCRHLLKITVTDNMTNNEVLQFIPKKIKLLNTIQKRKTAHLRYILRSDKYNIL